MAQRPYADRGAVDLIALLAEHCTHPQAHVIAAELELRVCFLAGIAVEHPDFTGVRDRAAVLLCGVPAGSGVFVCDHVDESGGLADDQAATDVYESGDLTGEKPA